MKNKDEVLLSSGEFRVKESASFKKVVAKTAPISKEEIRAILEKNIIKEQDSEDEEEAVKK